MRNAPPSILAAALVCVLASSSHAIDLNKDQMSDVWQNRFNASGLPPFADTDGDGFSNLEESILGTDPFDPASRLYTSIQANADTSMTIAWRGLLGKRYRIESSPDLVNWTVAFTVLGKDQLQQQTVKFAAGTPRRFLRVRAEDMDSDGDGLTDWEERLFGLDPRRTFSEGLGNNPASPTVSNPKITDFEKATAILNAATSTISVSVLDPEMAENWPDPGLVVFRRSGWESRTVVGRLDPITVNFSLGGAATPGADYVAPNQLSVRFDAGQDEVYLELRPIADDVVEGAETITVTLQAGTGYTVGSQTVANLTIKDAADGKPSLKEAARFLQQATFGPSPAELARVQDLGISAWLDAQFQRPVALHKPIVDQWQAELAAPNTTPLTPAVTVDHRIEAFWRQSMRSDVDSDPLRQRAAFALSQIFVISDRNSDISFRQLGVAGYQDVLLTNAFGSYRALLEAVTRHPWMGVYLSSIGNRKANPALNRFPDENYPREVMQLFSIGLWLLNPDGTHILSDGTRLGPDGEVIPAGESIPTYGQAQIETLARVFTGFNYGTRYVSLTDATEIPTTKFYDSYGLPWFPMRMFDAEHDLAAKTITLPGHVTLSLPVRTAPPKNGDTGAEGNADLSATLDWLANHPNVAPFICRQLIQRLVTSNPTPAYVGRVSAVFANNGSGIRGDLRAVFRAILTDSEARDPANLSNTRFGQVREPYTRYVSMARALEAAPADPVSSGGRFRGFSFIDGDFLQRPLSAPSVFNFYSPEYSPLGELLDANLASPELQIMNGVTAILLPNRFGFGLSVTSVNRSTTTNSGWTQLNPSTQTDNSGTAAVNEALWNTRINEDVWLPLAYGSPDAMVAAADRALCAGRLSAASFRTICRAVRRLDDPNATGITTAVAEQRALTRLRVALHLVTMTPECAVLR